MDIKNTILQIARKKRGFKVSDVVRASRGNVSRQYVARIISDLIKDKKLIKSGSTKQAIYALPENAAYLGKSLQKRYLNKGLKEHEVLEEIERQAPVVRNSSENIKSIFAYAFSEMFNNAIEHSKSQNIEVSVNKIKDSLSFTVRDFGIGVFKSVMTKRHLGSELEAIQDLLKGKTTTAPKAHSGEGIFFTSKIADLFILKSFGLQLRIDNNLPDIFIEETQKSLKGTEVTFSLSTNSKKHLNDIFKRFQTSSEELAFDKTEIQIKLYTMGTIYISRSQARRVLVGLDKFKSIILDFDKVPTVGQSFADEIFRVFQLKHPEIKIQPINMNEAVAFMIGRVEKPKSRHS